MSRWMAFTLRVQTSWRMRLRRCTSKTARRLLHRHEQLNVYKVDKSSDSRTERTKPSLGPSYSIMVMIHIENVVAFKPSQQQCMTYLVEGGLSVRVGCFQPLAEISTDRESSRRYWL